MAKIFQKDAETGRYVRNQNGKTYAVDDTTQAFLSAELSLGEMKGVSYSSEGTLVLDDKETFDRSLSATFTSGNFQSIYNTSQYIDSYNSPSGVIAGGTVPGDVVMIAGNPALVMSIDYSNGTYQYRDHNNEIQTGNQ